MAKPKFELNEIVEIDSPNRKGEVATIVYVENVENLPIQYLVEISGKEIWYYESAIIRTVKNAKVIKR